MISTLYIIIGAGILAILYGYVVGKQILSASPGNSKMQDIASAIQEGARAYLNRQYMTIGIVGIIIFVLIWWIVFFSLLPIDVDRKHKEMVEGADKGSPENPKIIKKNILNPEANTIAIQEVVINKVCPRSG